MGRSRTTFLVLLPVLVAALVASSGAASSEPIAPPAEDAFAQPFRLALREAGRTYYTFAQGSTSEATGEPGEPDHHYRGAGGTRSALPAHSLWFVWTAERTGPAQIDTCEAGGGAFNTILAVYTGSALAGLSPVASNDDSRTCGGGSNQSAVAFHGVEGTEYRIALDGLGSERGNFFLRLSQKEDAHRPANDDLAAAAVLTGFPADGYVASTEQATGEREEPDHHFDGVGGKPTSRPLESVWWSWTAPDNRAVELDTCASNFDTVLAVYTGPTMETLQPFKSNGDARGGQCGPAGLGSRVRFDAKAGTTYRIAVDGENADPDHGEVVLRLGPQTADPWPANDDFSGADPLEGRSVRATGTNVLATGEPGEPNHRPDDERTGSGAPIESVWYRWTAPATEEMVLDTCMAAFDTVLAVYTGTAVDALTPVARDDDGCGQGSRASRLRFNARAGETYSFAVDGFGSEEGAFELFIRPGPEGCTVGGTAGHEVLRGTPGSDRICARAGNDRVYGGGGKDVILLGPGNDVGLGQAGNDTIVGGEGRDRLLGGPGRDRLLGQDRIRRNDRLDGGPDRDRCWGDRGDRLRSC